ncbi:MAG: hypothetical protein UT05_C0008G0042 [Parcubacteria group bacterium GW2011_GWF2_38_76]|nr:MAG: hypothetical protein UT05_C0008G0042 [Parcubacteria group bacterium GW2011_GWF2_38_76]HBM45703.1 hypothetical protein [Patescibacteria group bacterium]
MKKIVYSAILIFLFLLPSASFGFGVIKNISAPVTGNFSLSPTKIEFDLEEGSIVKKELRISNGTGIPSEFQIDLEDVFDTDKNYQGNTLKISEYISVDNKKFRLDHGEEATVIITAHIPENNIEKFVGGAVLVSRRGLNIPTSNNSQVIVRSGSLVFINIDKTALRSGFLNSFEYAGDGIFRISFKNTGEAKLNPYGFIELRDIFGNLVERKNIEPWFVLPESDKINEINWEIPSKLQPLYKAHLVLYPGYGGGENTENESIFVYNFYTIFIYLFLFIIILIKFLKYVKK